jgi:hypothetical protein
LAAFADLPGVKIANWAAYTADDLLTGSNSFPRLLALMRTSDVIFVAGASLNDLAVLASKPVALVPGITSDPGSDRKYGLLLTDESARQGSLSDQSIAAAGLVSTATRTFRLAEPQTLELWARVLSSGTAGRLSFTLDRHIVSTLLPIPGAAPLNGFASRRPDWAPGRIPFPSRAADPCTAAHSKSTKPG